MTVNNKYNNIPNTYKIYLLLFICNQNGIYLRRYDNKQSTTSMMNQQRNSSGTWVTPQVQRRSWHIPSEVFVMQAACDITVTRFISNFFILVNLSSRLLYIFLIDYLILLRGWRIIQHFSIVIDKNIVEIYLYLFALG